MSDQDYEARVARLRAEAAAGRVSSDPRVAYFADWLLFYMDQMDETRDAWQRSIDTLRTRATA